MRVVLDTNVIVGAYVAPNGKLAEILRFWERGEFEVIASEAILSEYAEALAYPRIAQAHKLTAEQIADDVAAMREVMLVVEPAVQLEIVSDLDDNKLFECAVAGGAEFIVSGDKKVLDVQRYEHIQVFSPAQYHLLLVHDAAPVR